MIKDKNWRARCVIICIEFTVLFLFWLILISHYDLQYILLGIFFCALVTFFTHDILFPLKEKIESKTINRAIISIWYFILYIPWILWEIIKANLQVAFIILNPRMPVDPALLQFKTGYKWNFTRVSLANSITLTPGTITVLLIENTYIVHAITPETAGGIHNAKLINKVGSIFGEKYEQSPEIKRIYTLQEVGD